MPNAVDNRVKRPAHPAAFCVVKSGDTFFSGSMYTCTECGRQMRMPSNYLGDGQLVCTGQRFWKPHEQTRGKLGDDNWKALLRADDLKRAARLVGAA